MKLIIEHRDNTITITVTLNTKIERRLNGKSCSTVDVKWQEHPDYDFTMFVDNDELVEKLELVAKNAKLDIDKFLDNEPTELERILLGMGYTK